MANDELDDLFALHRTEIVRLKADLAEARAQIAAKDAALDTLDEAHQITQQGLWQDITELRASLAGKEQEHQDFRLQNDTEWRAKLDHIKAQIAAKDAALRQSLQHRDTLRAELAEARAQIAAKDAALREVDEVLTAHEVRTGKLHDMVLEARDAIRPNLEPDSPSWLREAFDKMHAIHHGMGGDPLVMHVRAIIGERSK